MLIRPVKARNDVIIESKRGVIYLSGYVRDTPWSLIEPTALILLATYPNGITIDCRGLHFNSSADVDAFVDILNDLYECEVPAWVSNLPEAVEGEIERRLPDCVHERLVRSGQAGGAWNNLAEPPRGWNEMFGSVR